MTMILKQNKNVELKLSDVLLRDLFTSRPCKVLELLMILAKKSLIKLSTTSKIDRIREHYYNFIFSNIMQIIIKILVKNFDNNLIII
jgi:hypothetical protein